MRRIAAAARESRKEVEYMKARGFRLMITLGSLAALVAVLGAGKKWS
jgi:hypothetical protein